jgi:hypothetical protein
VLDAFGLVRQAVDSFRRNEVPAAVVERLSGVSLRGWDQLMANAFRQVHGLILQIARAEIVTEQGTSNLVPHLLDTDVPKEVVDIYKEAYENLPGMSRYLAKSAAMQQIDEIVSALKSEPKAVPADILRARKELDLDGLDDPDFVSAYETLRKMVEQFDDGPERLGGFWRRQALGKLADEDERRFRKAGIDVIALSRQRPVDAAFAEVKRAIEAVVVGGRPGQLTDWRASLTPLDTLVHDEPVTETAWPDLSQTLTGDARVAKEPYTWLRRRVIELSKIQHEEEIADRAFGQIGELLGFLNWRGKPEHVEPIPDRAGLVGPIWDAYDQLLGLVREVDTEPSKRIVSRESMRGSLPDGHQDRYEGLLHDVLAHMDKQDRKRAEEQVAAPAKSVKLPWESGDIQHVKFTGWWNRGRWKEELLPFPNAPRLSVTSAAPSPEEGILLSENPKGRFSWVRLSSPPGVFVYPDAGCAAADVSACFTVPEGFAGLDPNMQAFTRPARCEAVSGGIWQVVEKGVIEKR